MRLKKAMLAVGTYRSPDGTIAVTPQRLKHWESTFRGMQKENLRIPIGWDHSDDPSKSVPVSFSSTKDKRRSAANTVGMLEDFKVTDDGNSAELIFHLPDEKAAEKAGQNLVEASPIIFPKWTDGKGREWADCITHVDLVNHPVDAGQQPFKPCDQPAIACSIRMGLDVGKPQLYRMADDGEEVGGTNDNLPNGTTDNPDLPTDTGDEEGKRFEAIVAHLETFDIVLPSDTDKDNFMDRLLTGLMTAKAAKDRAAAEEAADDDEDDDDMNKATESSPQFAAMSLQAQAAHGYAERSYRKDLDTRLDSLLRSGRCTPAEAKSQKEAMGAVKLSLNSQGEPEKGTVELWLESREGLPVGAVWPSEQRLRMATEVPAPLVSDEITDDEADDVVNQVFKRKPRKTETAKA